MKKTKLYLAALLLLSFGTTYAQSKTPADVNAKPKTSAVGQQLAALVKVITDSLSTQSPKSNPKKITYGTLTLIPDKIIIYEKGNTDRLLNPNLTAIQQSEAKIENSRLTAEQRYAYLQIDTAEVTFKKNKISSIRIISPTAGVAAFVGAIDPWDIKDTDTISITISQKSGVKHGVIRVSDCLSFLWLVNVDDNLESGSKTLTSKKLVVPINGY